MKIADIPQNVFDGIDKMYDRWPRVFSWVAFANALFFVFAIGREDAGLMAIPIGVVIAVLWAAYFAGKPKK